MHTYKNNNVLPPLFYKPNIRISSFCVTNKDILSIIKLLDSSKLHRYDNIPIKTKGCKESATIPLKRIFEKSLKTGIFPEIWKKANVVPVHTKRQTFHKKLSSF